MSLFLNFQLLLLCFSVIMKVKTATSVVGCYYHEGSVENAFIAQLRKGIYALSWQAVPTSNADGLRDFHLF